MKSAKVIMAIISIFILAACSGNPSENQGGSDDPIDAGDAAAGLADEPTKGSSKASAQSDLIQSCLSIQDDMWRQICAAAMNKDISMCDDVKHQEENEQKYHRSICRKWVAGADKDPSLCRSFDEGKEFLITSFSCYDFVAKNMKDEKVCDMIKDQNGKKGCLYDVDLAKGSLKISDCKDLECIYDHAWGKNDRSACDRFSDVTVVNADMHRTTCLAMLSGDVKACDPIKSQGVDEWYYCKTKAQFRQMMPAEGQFDFTSCKDNSACISQVMESMILYSNR